MTLAATPSHGHQVLTGLAPAGIAIVRLRGPMTAFISRHLRGAAWPAKGALPFGDVCRATLVDEGGHPLDDVVVSVRDRDSVPEVWLHLHGNPVLVRRCTELAAAAGLPAIEANDARVWASAEPIETAAWARLPDMLTLRGAAWLLGQIEQWRQVRATLATTPADILRARCRSATTVPVVDWFTRPLRVVLVGPPNAGKSTLANALGDVPASITSPHAGTTRDWVETGGEIDGFPVVWIDTAGVRADATDDLECASRKQTLVVSAGADLVVAVVDVTEPAQAEGFARAWTGPAPGVVVVNKTDLGDRIGDIEARLPIIWPRPALSAAALVKSGLREMKTAVRDVTGRGSKSLADWCAFTPGQASWLARAAVEDDHKDIIDMILRAYQGVDVARLPTVHESR